MVMELGGSITLVAVGGYDQGTGVDEKVFLTAMSLLEVHEMNSDDVRRCYLLHGSSLGVAVETGRGLGRVGRFRGEPCQLVHPIDVVQVTSVGEPVVLVEGGDKELKGTGAWSGIETKLQIEEIYTRRFSR